MPKTEAQIRREAQGFIVGQTWDERATNIESYVAQELLRQRRKAGRKAKRKERYQFIGGTHYYDGVRFTEVHCCM